MNQLANKISASDISIFDYCDRGDKSKAVSIGNLTLYFSYKTCVGFSVDGRTVVRDNSWGTTTGTHLNAIDGGDKKNRVSSEEFEKQLNTVLKQVFK